MSSSVKKNISVEVAYALPDKQKIIALDVEEGSTAYEVARRSKIVDQFADIDLETAKMGIFGKVVKPRDYKVRVGDRIEIYRSLIADPKAARRARAAKAVRHNNKS